MNRLKLLCAALAASLFHYGGADVDEVKAAYCV